MVIHKAKFKGVKDSGVSGLSIEELTEILKVQDGQELPCAARISDNEMERISSEAYKREENENKTENSITKLKFVKIFQTKQKSILGMIISSFK